MKSAGVAKVTSNSADVSGFVIAGDYTEYGVCWGLGENPTTSDNKLTIDKGTSAKFTVTITGLDFVTKYYARPYVIDSKGTNYGEQVTFTTLAILPTVVTDSISTISAVSAVCGGSISHNGGADITAKGVCWDTVPNPTIEKFSSVDGTGMDAFSSKLSGLKVNTTYYVRAYATNSAGTAYGEEISFTTLNEIEWYVTGNHQGWNPATAPTIYSSIDNSQILIGYVYLDGEFKFTANRNWDVDYGDDGADGVLDAKGANLSVPKPGIYYVAVDMSDMSYTLTATNWGIIGDATADGWNSDQDMVYSAANQSLVAVLDLTVASMKFRANDGWDLNYGDTGLDGSLEPGGDNIPVATAGTYVVMLNLSTPNSYTYSVNTWGVIGSATAGGWDSDTDLTKSGNKLVLTTNLSAGEIKFRANNAWDVNLGDSGADGTLDVGGDNIVVPSAGKYTITLDLINNTYTIVKN